MKARGAGGRGQGQWAWLLEEANRRIKFPTWPGRRVFLDAPLRCEWGPGDVETLSAGAEIGVEHLRFLRDEAELVGPRPAPPLVLIGHAASLTELVGPRPAPPRPAPPGPAQPRPARTRRGPALCCTLTPEPKPPRAAVLAREESNCCTLTREPKPPRAAVLAREGSGRRGGR